MTKVQRIQEYINKLAEKHNISYEEAEKLEIARLYMNYVVNDMEIDKG